MLITCVGGGNAGQIMATVEELLNSRVPDVEKQRIESHRFFFVTCVNPSSTVTFRGNYFPTNGQFQMLTFEWKFLFGLRGVPDELGAILLHEIGHTLNPAPPPGRNLAETEYYADDYARHCGFSSPLRRNLENCLQNKLEGFEPEATAARIRRIAANDPLKLDLVAPGLSAFLQTAHTGG